MPELYETPFTNADETATMITNKPIYSPGLVAIIARHREAGTVSVKELWLATDTSYSTAERICEGGWEAYERLQRALARLPLPVAHDIATDLLPATRFGVRVMSDADCGGTGGTCVALAGVVKQAELARAVDDADRDLFRSDAERAAIRGKINEARQMLDVLERENEKSGRRQAK